MRVFSCFYAATENHNEKRKRKIIFIVQVCKTLWEK